MTKHKCSLTCSCGKEAQFFHSKCCNAHFEISMLEPKITTVCEKCKKFVADIIPTPFIIKHIVKLKNPTYVRTKCCDSALEGTIKDNIPTFICEKCQKVIAFVKPTIIETDNSFN